MPDVDALAEDGHARRPGARDARRRWADEVNQALGEKRLSIHAAAKAAGMSAGRLQAWLSQDVEPAPRSMANLARVIGRGHLHLLRLLDWLPADLADVPLRIEATTRLNEAIADAQRWLEGAQYTIGLHSGSFVAGALLDTSREWQVSMRNTVRGHRYPVRYAMRVALSPVTDRGGGDPAIDRRRVEQLIPKTLQQTSASWLPPEELVGEDWIGRPDLVLSVPVLCASRPRGLQPNLVVPPSIAVLGVPHAGTRAVAALLADLLDWAYLDVDGLASEQYGLGPDTSATATEPAQVSIARRLLADPGHTAEKTVWSLSRPGPLLHTIRDLGDQLPLVVLLRAPDGLLARLCEQAAPNEIPETYLAETAQNIARRTLQSTRQRRTYCILDLPDLAPVRQPSDDGDTTFDAYVDLAFQAATWLHDEHGGPRPAEAVGLLGDLWRCTGIGPTAG